MMFPLVAVHSLFAECGSVFVDLALYLAVGGLCFGLVELFLLSFSLSSSSVVGSRSATSYLATALKAARGLHRCIRRLSCGLLEVGLRYVLDLAASRRLGHPCLPLHLWSHFSLLRSLHLFLKLFDITSTRSFQGVRISSGTFLL